MRQSASERHSFVVGGSLLAAVAVALVAFAWVSQPGATEAATDGAAMSLRVDASQTTACPGGPVVGKVCVGNDDKFDVIVTTDGIPGNGYIFAQAFLDYDTQGLVHKKNTLALWPDCSHDTFLVGQNESLQNAHASCFTGLITQPQSLYEGDLFSFSFTCTSGDSSSLIDLLPSGDAEAGTSGALYTEFGSSTKFTPKVSGIVVDCVPCPSQGCSPLATPTPTVTPTPNPVGGVALDSGLRSVAALDAESSSERASWLVAGSAVIAATLAAGAAAVVWKRRST